MKKNRILIFSETVTLAHLARPLELAHHLQSEGYEVFFAATQMTDSFKSKLMDIEVIPLQKLVTQDMFLKSISQGKHPYTEKILTSYIQEERDLIQTLKPDLVLGDMRLSLHVSCKLEGVTYINLSNTYWDSKALIASVVPDIPLVRVFGETISRFFFSMIKPLVFKVLARPFNKVAKKFGVPAYGNYMDVISSGDFTFYFDAAGFISRTEALPNKLEMGPLTYSIPMALPESVNFESSTKSIFISLGSSGPTHLLKPMLQALSSLDIEVFVATAGHQVELPQSPNIKVFSYLPFDEMVKGVDLVICSGGTSNVYPALAQGKPVLVIPSNFDQHLFSEVLVQHGVGLKIRSDSFNENLFKASVMEILKSSFYKVQAEKFKANFFNVNPLVNAQTKIQEILTDLES